MKRKRVNYKYDQEYGRHERYIFDIIYY